MPKTPRSKPAGGPARAATTRGGVGRGTTGRRRSLAADPVFEALAGAILRGKYHVGEALPPERELSQQFSVSRLIARQAMHRLRDMGLVKGGQGGQNTVLDPDQSSDLRISGLTMELAPEQTDQQHVDERQLLGGMMILELAEKRITDAQIDELEKTVKQLEGVGDDEREFGTWEAEFWIGIARATHNRLLIREARWWFDMLSRRPARARDFYDRPELRTVLYRNVVAGLRDKNGVALQFLEAVRPVLHRTR